MLYLQLARRAFQRQLAYRTENLAGLTTNAFFGYFRAAVFLAVFQHSLTGGSVAGYDQSSSITYIWITQAIIMVVALWGWWDVEQTIRTGDVVADLAKPFSYLGFWLARDLGRAAYFVLFRAAPILVLGQLLYGLHWPSSALSWLAFAISLSLGTVVSFGWRFLQNVSAFWTTDARGLGQLAGSFTLFLGGFAIPIGFMPDWLQQIARALPFAALIQTPADIFVERITGPDVLVALAQQVAWAVVLLGAAQALTLLATRRVVTQGG